MPTWEGGKLFISHLIDECTEPEAVLESATEIDKILKADKRFDDFKGRDCFEWVDEVGLFNFRLSQLYDYCDERRIWVAWLSDPSYPTHLKNWQRSC